jgi:hypothetical protein
MHLNPMRSSPKVILAADSAEVRDKAMVRASAAPWQGNTRSFECFLVFQQRNTMQGTAHVALKLWTALYKKVKRGLIPFIKRGSCPSLVLAHERFSQQPRRLRQRQRRRADNTRGPVSLVDVAVMMAMAVGNCRSRVAECGSR